jgi:sugar phosphate isomerase/epimerase
MQLAVSTTFDYELSLSEQFALIRGADMQFVSLGARESHSDYLSQTGRARLLRLAHEFEIDLDSLHVPIARGYDLSNADAEPRMAAVCRVALCMASAAELHCRTVILHLTHYEQAPYEQRLEPLLESLEVLIESAENMKINLAAENLYDRTSLRFLERTLEELDSPRYGLCYDSSHDQLSGMEPYSLLEKYSDRLLAVHLSDNDGQDDRHWIPFTGQVDWDRICSQLHDVRFKGPLLLEVENRSGQNPEEFMLEASMAGERLVKMIGR